MGNHNTFVKNFRVVLLLAVVSLIILVSISENLYKKNMMSEKQGRGTGIALHDRFSSLQDYLDWGRKSRIADLQYYQEISSGKYQITPGRGHTWDKMIYSYEELRKKLGFAR